MANSDFNIWYKSFNESFLYINERSNIKDDWLDYNEILKTEYKDSIIKPINKYIYKLSSPPRLISIDGNNITLCQDNFAEIFLLKKENSSYLRAVEKIHMRQFYLSKDAKHPPSNCFDQTFRWAMPWFIDYDNIDIRITNVENSPFYFYNHNYISKKNQENRINTKMLFFNFKKEGSHMIDHEYGRIKRKQPLYLLKFTCDDIILEKIKEFYGKN